MHIYTLRIEFSNASTTLLVFMCGIFDIRSCNSKRSAYIMHVNAELEWEFRDLVNRKIFSGFFFRR